MTSKEDRDRIQLGEKLKECREYLGYSQDEAASAVGLSRSAISLIESGSRKVDALELKGLAELYERPVSFFTGETVGHAMDSRFAAFARKHKDLSENDFKELSRFAEYLKSRGLSRKG